MEFIEHLKSYLNDEEIDKLVASFSEKEKKGLYLNTNKISKEDFEKEFPLLNKHPIVPEAYIYQKDEYEFGKNIYHDLGCYYLCDPSAMLVSHILSPSKHMHILDMCAAPGGKSIISSLLAKQNSIIYANDISYSRVEILLDNIERIGLENVVVLNIDMTNFKGYEEKFDAIILDAPCSGSGMFRKKKEMVIDWTYEKVLKYAHIQKQLIMKAYSMLKPGGRLVYSTCSYSKEEDEDVVNHLLSNSDATLINIEDNALFYRSYLKETIHLFPSLFPGEGHYIALIKKPGELNIKIDEEKYFSKRTSTSKGKEMITYNFSLPFKPYKLADISIRPGLYISSEIKGNKKYSYHYAHFINSNNSYPLNDEQFKKYLHGETLSCNEDKNIYFVSYKNINVGPVNKVGNILKNLYPKKLRI